ncbi:TPA: hypothetical protein HA246_05125, partial [Candidatus Woesearchaeota archaeon]|nr:hypothetical protein [Candidatus Woesearchaeota archaeon]
MKRSTLATIVRAVAVTAALSGCGEDYIIAGKLNPLKLSEPVRQSLYDATRISNSNGEKHDALESVVNSALDPNDKYKAACYAADVMFEDAIWKLDVSHEYNWSMNKYDGYDFIRRAIAIAPAGEKREEVLNKGIKLEWSRVDHFKETNPEIVELDLVELLFYARETNDDVTRAQILTRIAQTYHYMGNLQAATEYRNEKLPALIAQYSNLERTLDNDKIPQTDKQKMITTLNIPFEELQGQLYGEPNVPLPIRTWIAGLFLNAADKCKDDSTQLAIAQIAGKMYK